jgi:transcriptional regulator with XRE-family HTH domain
MNEKYSAELLAELAARAPEERAQLLRELELTESESAEVRKLGESADALWATAHGAPPLENDQTAALLGLVPDPAARLDGKNFSQLRKRASLKIDEVANQLAASGWEVTTKDVFLWERGNTDSVSPALIQELSRVLGLPIDRLVERREVAEEKPERSKLLREHPRFQDLSQRWARIRQIPVEVAESMLCARIAATVHRGEAPDIEQNIASLEALVKTFEKSKGD